MKKTPTARIDKLLGSMGYGSRAEIARAARIIAERGKSAILVTHDHGEAEVIADETVRMDAGRLLPPS